ncbi:MAG: VTT domain-containing protein, partial [Pseudomonadota bacterium]
MTTQTAQAAAFSWRKLVPLALIGAVAALAFFFLGDFLTFDTLAQNREALIAWRDANYAISVAVFIVIYAAVVAFSLPGAAIMTLTGGFLFGVFPGSLIVVVAATLGATAIFLAARTGLGAALHARLTERPGLMQRMETGLRENELSFLFLMRLVPVIPFFLANLA